MDYHAKLTPIFSSFNLVLIVKIDLKFDCWKQLPTAFSDHVYILKYKPVSGYHCRLFCGQVPIIKSVILGGCGALVAWRGILTPAGSKVISGLIVNYTLPALLFSKMVSCLNLENVQELGLVALVAIFYIAVGAFFGYKLIRYDHVKEAKRLQSLSVATASGADGNGESKNSSPTAASLNNNQVECNLNNSDETGNSDDLYRPYHGSPKSTQKGNLIPTTWHRKRSHTSVSTATTIVGSVHGKEPSKVVPQPKQPSSSSSSPSSSSPSPLISLSPISPSEPIEPSLPLSKSHRSSSAHSPHTSITPVSPDELPPLSFILDITLMLGGFCVPLGLTVLGATLSRLKPGRMRPLVPTLALVSMSKVVLSPLIGIYLVQGVLVRHYGLLDKNNHMLQFTLMLMSGSLTSVICLVLALVWDRRIKNAGSEMAALMAVQYAVATVLVTVQSGFMVYFLF
ncbi:MAG: hypothetical protein BYD32DRAFT_464390 [Podila humilis]|nr:MAG: hypothetical protein BYD32DRAFT_464390 [Podila humilis]